MSNNILPFEYVENRKQNGLKFYLEKLSLKNFRNHVELDLHVNAVPILIYGDNGSGKTNILEAISLLNQGKGLRKSNLQDFLYQNTENEPNYLWGINADIKTPKGKFNIGTGIKYNQSQKSRIAKVNSENFLLSTLDKIVKILWITPQMCMLFQSGMSSKRRFLDQLASSLDSFHLSRVYKFEALLRNRNKILMDHKIDEAWLDTIEGHISELSVAITATRIDLINELNNLHNNELKNNLFTNTFPPVEVKLSGKVEILPNDMKIKTVNINGNTITGGTNIQIIDKRSQNSFNIMDCVEPYKYTNKPLYHLLTNKGGYYVNNVYIGDYSINMALFFKEDRQSILSVI